MFSVPVSIKDKKEIEKHDYSLLILNPEGAEELSKTYGDKVCVIYLDVPLEDVDSAIIATDEITSIDEKYDSLKYFDNINADLLDLHDSIDKLSDDERNLIIARYYDGMTQNEASKILGISQVQVSRNEAKILKKLRTSL